MVGIFGHPKKIDKFGAHLIVFARWQNLYYMISVARLADFLMFFAKKILTKVGQLFVDIFGLFRKYYLLITYLLRWLLFEQHLEKISYFLFQYLVITYEFPLL